MDGFLLTENGKIFQGKVLGDFVPTVGELVFTTSMQGYTESVTDPSYAGQILVFSFPLIGNYGFNPEHMESNNIWVRGIVVLNIYEKSSFIDFLVQRNIPILTDIDTRMLVREITAHGSLMAVIYPGDPKEHINDAKYLLEKSINPNKTPLFRETASNKILKFNNNKDLNLLVIDFGVKNGILNNLKNIGNLTLIPYYENFNEYEYDGIVLSNGPGDPAHSELQNIISKIKNFKVPVLGICLGHQLLARSFNLETYKMKFGHRGINHPVKFNGRTYITTHNHGYAVKFSENKEIIFNQFDLNDNTVEGFQHIEKPILSVQYHPESRPGTSDTNFIFKKFERMVREFAKEP